MSSLHTGGQIISNSRVRVGHQPVVVTDKHADGSAIVSVKRDGNRISEIHVRCGCGELIILDCEYDIPGPAARR